MDLDPNNVPPAVVALLPFAARWGVSDDGFRADAVESASTEDLEALIHCIDDVSDDDLYGWLSGSEANNPRPTAEYVAMTCLTMAIDSARVELRRRRKGVTPVSVRHS